MMTDSHDWPKSVSVKSPQCKNAAVALESAIEECRDLFNLYPTKRGSPSHTQQNLLRAMLVFACTSVDTVIKRLVEDKALNSVIKQDAQAHKMLKDFVERELKKDSPSDMKTVAAALVSEDPKAHLLSLYCKNLTDGSLQSLEKIRVMCRAFNIAEKDVWKKEEEILLKDLFGARNEIIHEMDIDFSVSKQGKKNRRLRQKDKMLNFAQLALRVACCFLEQVDKKISVG